MVDYVALALAKTDGEKTGENITQDSQWQDSNKKHKW
jgi:hypothetical protein